MQCCVVHYSAGCHLQRTGDTMAPSFLSWANALSTSLRSIPERVATSPADTGLPALRIVSSTLAVVSIWDVCFIVSNYYYCKYNTLIRDSPYLKMVVGFDVAYGILLAASGRLVGGLLTVCRRLGTAWGCL